MRLLFVILLVCLAALLWAFFGFVRHVRLHRRRQTAVPAERTLEGR